MESSKLIELAHVVANQNPQGCVNEVNEFVKDKSIITKIYNTTPMVVGVDKLGQAQTVILTTCFITWAATQDEKKSFETRQSLTLVK